MLLSSLVYSLCTLFSTLVFTPSVGAQGGEDSHPFSASKEWERIRAEGFRLFFLCRRMLASCHEILSPRAAANVLDWTLTFLNRMPTLLLCPRR